MKKPERFIELDVWRGGAIIAMVLFHFVFLQDFLGYQRLAYDEGIWFLLARFVQWSFLLLVGIGIRLSWQKSVLYKKSKVDFLFRQLKKGVIVLSCAWLITLLSALLVPEAFVRFGILHLIGVSILGLSFLADRPNASAFVAIFIYLLSFIVQSITVHQEWLLIFGFYYRFQSLDYFPIIPWMAIPALGISLGSRLYPSFAPKIKVDPKSPYAPLLGVLAFLGKYSLFIYMAHIPVLLGLVVLLY